MSLFNHALRVCDGCALERSLRQLLQTPGCGNNNNPMPFFKQLNPFT